MNADENLLCKQANQVDLVDYLKRLGHHPQKIRGNDCWYLSPLRHEKTASFKVNRKLNLWYDHGNERGGTLVDFGIFYFNCSVKDLLIRLRDEKALNVSFQTPSSLRAVEKKETTEDGSKVKIISSQEISHPDLLDYLQQRKIPLAIAKEFCQEVCFELYAKKQLAIGFKNDSGGYELRNRNFKGGQLTERTKINPTKWDRRFECI